MNQAVPSFLDALKNIKLRNPIWSSVQYGEWVFAFIHVSPLKYRGRGGGPHSVENTPSTLYKITTSTKWPPKIGLSLSTKWRAPTSCCRECSLFVKQQFSTKWGPWGHCCRWLCLQNDSVVATWLYKMTLYKMRSKWNSNVYKMSLVLLGRMNLKSLQNDPRLLDTRVYKMTPDYCIWIVYKMVVCPSFCRETLLGSTKWHLPGLDVIL